MDKQVMCPHCGNISPYGGPSEHLYCGKCGQPLPTDLKPIEYQCGKCGNHVKAENLLGTMNFCEVCGTKL